MRQLDTLHRFTIEESPVRGVLVRLDETWQEALRRKEYPAPVKKVLGEAMAAGALLTSSLKFDGSLTIQVQGDGLVHLLVVQINSDRSLRGLARWHEPKAGEQWSEGAALGEGQLIMTVETQKGDRYQGVVPVEAGDFRQALETYFAQSEQLATRVWLAVNDHVAAGLMLQELPGRSEEDDVWDRSVALADTVKPEELLELPADQLLHRLFHEDGARLYEGEDVSYRCTCSRERVGTMLKSLGRDEAEETLKEQGSISVNCEFCGAHYGFDAVDVEQLFADGSVAKPGQVRH